MRVVLPPVQAVLLGFVHGTDQESNSDGQQFHVRYRNANVACDHQSLVQNAVQDIYEISRSGDAGSVHEGLLMARGSGFVRCQSSTETTMLSVRLAKCQSGS